MSDANEFLFGRLDEARAETAAVRDKIEDVSYLVGYYDLLADTTSNADLADMVRDLKAALLGTLDKDVVGRAAR